MAVLRLLLAALLMWGLIWAETGRACANTAGGADRTSPHPAGRRLLSDKHALTISEVAFLARAACEETPEGSMPPEAVLKYIRTLSALARQSGDYYDAAVTARAKAEAARACAGRHSESQRLAEEAERDLDFLDGWLSQYGQKNMVHRRQEPAWINGQPEVVAQAVLAWITLERVHPDAERRQKISKFCEGLCALLEPEAERYPFGAHVSRSTLQGKPRNYSLPDSDDKVAGYSIIIERQYCASALARAGKLLKNKDFIASACAEGSGLMAHLAMLDCLPYTYAPRPENEIESPLATAAVVENLADVYLVTGLPMYGDLAGCAAINANGYTQGAVPRAVRSWTRRQLGLIGFTNWLDALDYKPANNGQVIELENGRAVEKSFSVHDIAYLGGTPGRLAVVGRDNMFWMRFDVDREDSYYFHLCFLKRDASGGLVAVQMRIDGDSIFEVSLDGATEDPYVDAELVAGPRLLRQGPHSFGIRFSGLLMRSPAWLDSIMVEPAVQRRWVQLADGSTRVIFNSVSSQDVKMRIEELEDAGNPGNWQLCTRAGRSLNPEVSTDRRGRVWLEMPAKAFGELIWPGVHTGATAEE
ncbi:hypothetical protein IJT17_10485 [bacterium]|nr:hypothetical protein [bacterium]